MRKLGLNVAGFIPSDIILSVRRFSAAPLKVRFAPGLVIVIPGSSNDIGISAMKMPVARWKGFSFSNLAQVRLHLARKQNKGPLASVMDQKLIARPMFRVFRINDSAKLLARCLHPKNSGMNAMAIRRKQKWRDVLCPTDCPNQWDTKNGLHNNFN